MNDSEIRAIAANVTIGHPFSTWAPSLEATLSSDGRLRVYVTIHPPDRDTGAPIEAGFWDVFPAPTTTGDVLAAVRAVLHKAVQHELDESIHFEGARPFDPHRRSKRATGDSA